MTALTGTGREWPRSLRAWRVDVWVGGWVSIGACPRTGLVGRDAAVRPCPRVCSLPHIHIPLPPQHKYTQTTPSLLRVFWREHGHNSELDYDLRTGVLPVSVMSRWRHKFHPIPNSSTPVPPKKKLPGPRTALLHLARRLPQGADTVAQGRGARRPPPCRPPGVLPGVPGARGPHAHAHGGVGVQQWADAGRRTDVAGMPLPGGGLGGHCHH